MDSNFNFSEVGAVVGMKEEARLLRRFFPHLPIALSHAHEKGAFKAVARLKEAGVKRLLSFGCAGGLSPHLSSGTVMIAHSVHIKECHGCVSYPTDEGLNDYFSSLDVVKGGILHSSYIVPKASDKKSLFDETGCLGVDMESGAVALSGLPFSVLRVICDDSQKDLPQAAFVALKEGNIHLLPLISSLISKPSQIASLIDLGKEAVRARKVMREYLENISYKTR